MLIYLGDSIVHEGVARSAWIADHFLGAGCGHAVAGRRLSVRSAEVPLPGEVSVAIQLYHPTLARSRRSGPGIHTGDPPWCVLRRVLLDTHGAYVRGGSGQPR